MRRMRSRRGQRESEEEDDGPGEEDWWWDWGCGGVRGGMLGSERCHISSRRYAAVSNRREVCQ